MCDLIQSFLSIRRMVYLYLSRAFLVCHALHMSPIGERFSFFVRSIYTGNWTQYSVRVRVEREQFLCLSPSASTSLLADWLSKRSNDLLSFSSRDNDYSKETLMQDVFVNVPIDEIGKWVIEANTCWYASTDEIKLDSFSTPIRQCCQDQYGCSLVLMIINEINDECCVLLIIYLMTLIRSDELWLTGNVELSIIFSARRRRRRRRRERRVEKPCWLAMAGSHRVTMMKIPSIEKNKTIILSITNIRIHCHINNDRDFSSLSASSSRTRYLRLFSLCLSLFSFFHNQNCYITRKNSSARIMTTCRETWR